MSRTLMLSIAISCLLASASFAQPMSPAAVDPADDAQAAPLPLPADATSELDAAQISLLDKAADPATTEMSLSEILQLGNDPAIQQVGWACCLGDCWEAWGVCLDACPEGPTKFTCRQACHTERRACINDCGQAG